LHVRSADRLVNYQVTLKSAIGEGGSSPLAYASGLVTRFSTAFFDKEETDRSIGNLWAGKINVRASNDCGSSKAISLDVGILNALLAGSNSKSISKNTSSKTSLQILPNPSKDIAYLLFNTKISMPYAIEVTDVTGKVLFTHKFIAVAGENKEQINLQPYSNGLYFIKLINNNGNREMMKVIKE